MQKHTKLIVKIIITTRNAGNLEENCRETGISALSNWNIFILKIIDLETAFLENCL